MRVYLFGPLRVEHAGHPVAQCNPLRVRELLCFLLLHRSRTHRRESVASALWGEGCTTAQAKAYLRKALWQLQAGLRTCLGPGADVIEADTVGIRCGASPRLWSDVSALEDAYHAVRDVPGHVLTEAAAADLEAAARLYAGDLLDGWFHEWSLIERERVQRVYLRVLDKLMAYAERTGRAEAGLSYAERSLACDRARECTYRAQMRLHAALGDRTGALRAFERCRAALEADLDARPSTATQALAETVRTGGVVPGLGAEGLGEALGAGEEGGASLVDGDPAADRLARLVQLQRQVSAFQAHVAGELAGVQQALALAVDAEKERTGIRR